jgi:hypothetical protein
MKNVHLIPRPSMNEYQLYILPGRCPPNYAHTGFHNEVYGFWKRFWEREFANNKSSSQPDAGIFYRQDTVAVIKRFGSTVGTFFCTENNIESNVTTSIPYFSRPHIDEFCLHLKSRGIFQVATCEMLSVNPEFRKRATGISFGLVLVGVVTEAFKEGSAKTMIGPVRLDNGAQKLLMDFGWKLVSKDYEMHGTPVALGALRKEDVKECGDAWTQKFIQKLWAERIDMRIPTEMPVPQRLALAA